LIAEQAVPQALQFSGSLLVFTSQPFVGSPSQSAKGAMHVAIVQLPPVQAAVACGSEQGVSHAPQ
jgi:hypothetical protein